MMKGNMSTTITKPVLRFDAVREVTGLEWFHAQDRADVPAAPGVYCAIDEAGGVHYHGAGGGARGLRQRVGNEHLKWKGEHIRALEQRRDNPSDEDEAWKVMTQSPAIRQIAENDLQIWAAVAAPAPWALPGYSPDGLPALARQWEALISALSHIVCGHRSSIGGGAWESKRGTVAYAMTNVVWDRLVDLGYHWNK